MPYTLPAPTWASRFASNSSVFFDNFTWSTQYRALSLPHSLSLSVSDCVTVTVCACQVAIETGGIWVCVAHIHHIPYMTSDFHLSENICFQNTTRGRSGVQKYGRTENPLPLLGRAEGPNLRTSCNLFFHSPTLCSSLTLSLSLSGYLSYGAVSHRFSLCVCVPVFR